MSESWTWTCQDAMGLDVQVPGGDTEFPTQADAEAWLTESWRDIADAGATQVTLRNGVDVVYGPMPLAEG